MFKINSITDAQSASIDLKNPTTGELLGASIELAGPEHPQRKSIEFAKQRKMRQSIQKTGKFELTDPAEDELDAIDKLVSCTLSWEGICADDGTPIPFSREAAAKLYGTEGLGWLRAQLYNALEERERFIKACVQS